MFSRTTMASSISRPTLSDSAISVIVLSVKPNAYIARKVPISAIGSVSPVITVLRQDFRNRKTMAIVSAAPSSSVRLDVVDRGADADRAVAHDAAASRPAGSCGLSSRTASLTPSATAMVFAPWTLTMSRLSARWPSTSAAELSSCWPSTTLANCSSRTGAPPRVATIRRPKACGSSMRPRTLTRVSLRAVSMLPAGSSWFSRASVPSTWSMPMPSARMRAGSSTILISRLHAADHA